MRFPVPRLDIYDVPFRVVYQNFNNRFNSVRLLEVVFSASLQTRCSFERLALSVSRLTYRRCKLAAVLLRRLRGADPGKFAPPGSAMSMRMLQVQETPHRRKRTATFTRLARFCSSTTAALLISLSPYLRAAGVEVWSSRRSSLRCRFGMLAWLLEDLRRPVSP